jgi:hypothetical protein
MEAETDTDVEYERLREGLVWAGIDDFARSAHAAQRHLDGSPKLAHLYVVSELAGRHAERFYSDGDLFEKRYMTLVCKATGLLHEAMGAGRTYEDLVDAADEAVASLVAAVTPDGREPRSKRVHLLANRVGLAPEPAQLVVLADLQHEVVGLRAVLARSEPPVAAVRQRSAECGELSACLGKIGRSAALAGVTAALAAALKDLDRRCREAARR